MKNACHPRYARHRFPAEVISYAVWLYFRFPLSLRMVEEMLAARGIQVSYETVRQWAMKFGQGFAHQIRRRLPAPGDKWHLDEVVISIAAEALALASGRPARGCARHPGSEPPQCESGQTPAAQAAQEAGHGSTRDDHRQTGQLRCSQARDHARCRTPAASRIEQSRGEQPSAHPTTGAHHEVLQVGWAGPTVPIHP